MDDPVSSNGYSHSHKVPWAIKRFPCTSCLVLLLFIPRMRSRISEAVFKRSKSSHFVSYLVMKCEVMSLYHYAFRFSSQAHERVRKMIKLEAFLMCTTAQEIEDERAVDC